MARRPFWLLAVAGLLVGMATGCAPGGAGSHTYQIVVNGSTTPVPVQFTGSYTCEDAGQERISDVSGEGTTTVSFDCEKLLHVRIQRVLGDGLISLTVYRNGEVVYSMAPTDSVAPIVFVPAES